MRSKMNEFFQKIKKDCFELIALKKVDIGELSFLLGISEKKFYQNFTHCIEDLTFYLKTYDLLVEWGE